MDKDAAPRQVGEPAPDPNNNSPHPLTPHTPKLPLPALPGFKVQTSPHLLPNPIDGFPQPSCSPCTNPDPKAQGQQWGDELTPVPRYGAQEEEAEAQLCLQQQKWNRRQKEKKKKGSRILEEENLGYKMMLKERRAVPGRGMVLQ